VGALCTASPPFRLVQPARGVALQSLIALLGHAFPRVRKHVAEALYVRLLTLDDLFRGGSPQSGPDVPTPGTTPAPDLDAALAVLSDTAWDGASLAEARSRRERVFLLLGVAPPPDLATVESGTGAGSAAGAARRAGGGAGVAGGDDGGADGEDGSYGALVREMGY
jgi:hypothetical protein